MARILVIDDEEMVRNLLHQALTREGHEVRTAANGAEGIALHEQSPADLIITDIFMPEREGIETMTHFQIRHPKVTLFAMSGDHHRWGVNVLEVAQRFGALRTFKKPLNLQEVSQAVKAVLGRKSP